MSDVCCTEATELGNVNVEWMWKMSKYAFAYYKKPVVGVGVYAIPRKSRSFLRVDSEYRECSKKKNGKPGGKFPLRTWSEKLLNKNIPIDFASTLFICAL